MNSEKKVKEQRIIFRTLKSFAFFISIRRKCKKIDFPPDFFETATFLAGNASAKLTIFN